MKFSIVHSLRWAIFISIATFFLAAIFSVTATAVMDGATAAIGVLIVFLLIANGIFFDIMGLAAAAATETPLHAMASEKVKGARHAISIVRNADRFSNFCNDVIGDISSVISGAAGAAVVIKLISGFQQNGDWFETVVTIAFSATVSALTVGGKALGKSVAIHYANHIVLWIGKLFYLLEHKLGVKLFSPNRTVKKQNGKRGNKRARTNQSA